MLFQQLAQCSRFFNARNHPESVPEHIPIVFVGKWIVAVLAFLRNQIQETPHISLMHKLSLVRSRRNGTKILFRIARPCTEELAEIERHILCFIAIRCWHRL